MRALTVAGLLLVLAGVAVAELTLEQRVDLLWERAVRQSDFAKWDDALETGRHAVVIAPGSADAWALRAYVNWLHPDGRADIAMSQVQRALGLNPASARARMMLGTVIPWATDPPEFERAMAELERAVALDPELARAWAMLGLARLDSGDAPGALEALQRTVALEPDYYEWQLGLGEALSSVGEQREAVAVARRAVELSFSDFSEQLTRNNLAWEIVLLMPDDEELRREALMNARRAVAIAPDDPENLDTLGTVEALLGGTASASETAFAAAVAAGNDSYAGLGYALARQGKEAEAREALGEYSAAYLAGGTSAHDAVLAALAWDALDDPQITRRICETAVERWPDHPWADVLRQWLAEN